MVVTFSLMLAAGLLVAIFRSEFEAWMPWIAERLRRLALKSLEGSLRDRFDEEWSAHLEETPGYLGKVISALGFIWAARQISIRSWLYRLGYRGTMSTAFGLKRLSQGMMKVAQLCYRLPGPQRLGNILGNAIAKLALDIVFAAMSVMFARAFFIEDANARAAEESQQMQSLNRLEVRMKEAFEQLENDAPKAAEE